MIRSSVRGRRRGIVIGHVVCGLLLLAVLCVLLAVAFSKEHVTRYRVEAAIQPDGSALIREVISYDFGSNSRHGIFRTFPGYAIDERPRTDLGHVVSGLTVASPSAPDDLQLDRAYSGELRVGDPDTTVTGRHEYIVEYRLPDAARNGRLALNVIGTGWDVPIDKVDATIRLPAQVSDPVCYHGGQESRDQCESMTVDDRTLRIADVGLDEGQGLTIYGTFLGAGEPTSLGPAPELSDGDSMWFMRSGALIVALAVLAYVVASVPIFVYARRAGRDVAWRGSGPADAVYGGPGIGTQRISDSDAARQVVLQFVPPRSLTPAQGGVLLREKITNDHRVAWLMEYVLTDWISIDKNGKSISWTAQNNSWAHAPAPLRTMFTGRDRIDLGKYDKKFAEGWKLIDAELKGFIENSGLWDHALAGRPRRILGLITGFGLLAMVACGIVVAFTARNVVLGSIFGALAGLFAGAAVAAGVNRIEVYVRTPQGFAAQQLTEGFRRFFVGSEGRHAREAAEAGRLREYTAWAVGLGELDHWNKLVKAADLPTSTPGLGDALVYSTFASSTSTASTPPSSSGSSGGGGGVGGGGGGGGGGSW